MSTIQTIEAIDKRQDTYPVTINGRQTLNYCRYRSMLKRCYNPNELAYPRYGGRGITVCGQWLGPDGFQNFMRDMGDPADPTLQLDRINNDAGYSKDNCRWANRKTQTRNTCRNRILTIDGESLCVAEWSERSGVPGSKIAKRLRRGWSAKDAVFTLDSSKGVPRKKRYKLPPQEGVSAPHKRFNMGHLAVTGDADDFIIPNGPDHVHQLQGPWLQMGTRERLLIIDNVCKPFSLWLQETDTPHNVVSDRLKRGWSDKDALFTPAFGIGKKRPGIRRKINLPPNPDQSPPGSLR